MRKALSFLFLLFCLLGVKAIAEDPASNATVSLILPSYSVRPGSDVDGVIQFSLEEGWHLYWKNPGEVGLAPSFDWKLPEGISVQEILWPAPSRYPSGTTMIYGYGGLPKWIVRFHVDESVKEGTYPIEVASFWLACDGSCVPGNGQSSASLQVSASAIPPPEFPELITAKKSLPLEAQGATLFLSEKHLIVSLPLSSEKSSLIEKTILFPEVQGLFPVETTPKYAIKEDSVEITVPISEKGQELLETTGRFSGLLQLLYVDGKKESFNVTTTLSEVSVTPIPEKDQDDQTFLILLSLAFLGGMILNVTPCALPVIGIRILQLISSRDEGKTRTFYHGLAYTLGVLLCFWVLAAFLYGLEYLGSTMGWGFQLQEPRFVAVLIIILFILALSLFGLVEIGTSVAAWASGVGAQQKRSLFASFTTGLLATVVATPCTGPLLGSVLGFAVTFNLFEGFLLFTILGLGMAFPFLIVSIFPVLVHWVPKPGPWMVSLKQFFGFLVLATVIWLLWVLEGLVPELSLTLVSFSLLFLAAATWIYGRWAAPVRGALTKGIARLLALCIAALGTLTFFAAFDGTPLIQLLIPSYQQIQWKPYSEQQLHDSVKANKIVFIKFSAKWCLTCQTNAITFLRPSVAETFQKYDVVALEADWTDGDPKITEKLRSLGRNGVPVSAIFKRGKPPIILPEIVTQENIEEAFKSMSEE